MNSRPSIRVTIGFLFEDPDVLDTVDFEASRDKFEEQLKAKFAELAPGCEVNIDVADECEGDHNSVFTSPRDKELERTLERAMNDLLNKKWEGWCVNQ